MSRDRIAFGVLVLALIVAFCGCVPAARKAKHSIDPQATRLVEAIATNDTTKANRLLAAGLNVNGRDATGITPLLQALLSQNKPMFEALLAYHASPDQCDDSGRCVMNQAATLETPCWLETALAKGGNPDAQNVGNPHVPSRTPIYYTIMRRTFEIDPWRARNAEILIRAGADVDHLNDEGETPLRSAAASGNYEIVVKLLEAGADPALGDPSRLSLVDWFIGRDESMVVHDEQLPWFRKARDILSERGLLGHER